MFLWSNFPGLLLFFPFVAFPLHKQPFSVAFNYISLFVFFSWFLYRVLLFEAISHCKIE